MDLEKASEIAKGFKNLIKSKILLSEGEIENLAEVRNKVCNLCSYKSNISTCKKCGCYLPAKVRSETSSCPIKLW